MRDESQDVPRQNDDAFGAQRSSLLGYLALLAAIVLGWLAVNAVMAVLAVL